MPSHTSSTTQNFTSVYSVGTQHKETQHKGTQHKRPKFKIVTSSWVMMERRQCTSHLQYILMQDDVEKNIWAEFFQNKSCFADSTQQQFSRNLNEFTSQMVIEKIWAEWLFWDRLHGFCKELLNYHPVGVSNSSASQDFEGYTLVLIEDESDKEDQSLAGSSVEDVDHFSKHWDIVDDEGNGNVDHITSSPTCSSIEPEDTDSPS
ncbi:hypothetical protein L218DRAFT_946445 [Marasmius fiardii PR-910]|nr:hypothetical protein L218DRAFT_946445 [Marasmius fiardii PR-910]